MLITVLEIDRLALRIETLQRVSTSDWHPADELEFKNLLPGGRDRRALPYPEKLRQKRPEDLKPHDWGIWLGRVLHMEGLKSSNRPRSLKQTIRDLCRGRFRNAYRFR